MDPYVKLVIGPVVFRTKTKDSAGKHPNWSDIFEFHRTTESNMQVYVYDEDVTSDDLVGQADIDLNAICNSSSKSLSAYVQLRYKGKSAGEIFLDIIFHPDNPTGGYPIAPSYAPTQPVQYPTYVPTAPNYPPMQPVYNPTAPTYVPGPAPCILHI